jgi:hypothetical protein
MLLDGGTNRQFVVKLFVMAKYDPAFRPNFCEPFIIASRLIEMEPITLVMMELDKKRRLCFPNRFGKADTKTTVKVECQCTRDFVFPLPDATLSNSSAFRTPSF